MRRVAAAALVALLAGLAPSAGGPGVAGAAARTAGGAKPCKVLTRAEIAEVFGQPVGKGSDALGTTFCQWDLAATDTRARGQVNAFVAHGRAAKRNYKLLTTAFGDLEAVPDLGRNAFFNPATGTLFVRTADGTFFYVQANLYADPTTRVTAGLAEGLTTLATAAEARV